MSAVRTRLTKVRHKAIVDAVRNGMPFVQACVLSNVRKSTGLEWLQRGRGEHKRKAAPVFTAFAQAIDKAEAEFEQESLKTISEAGQPHEVKKSKVVQYKDGRKEQTVETRTQRSWQALAWLLERKYPDRYARKWRPETDEGDEPPHVVNLPAGGPGE